MAELEQKQVGTKGKKKGRKKMSTRVDLTPMVDLGFLLVTFFMLTTTFSKPQTMEINMPVKPRAGDPPVTAPVVAASKTVHIIIDEENRLFWYRGLATQPLDPLAETNFSALGIRKVLLEKNSSIDGMIVLIKPTNGASYKNVVDILDEMNITNVKRYAIVDVDPADFDLLKEYKKI
ncbi:MAG TPA: biopolymer transporter ExbD [Ignavibacteriaceae bacterium]|jgi:biopolymer transport protein ExbD|nr:biopolymer transporter ExbD [Ignavibacteriaceae bacterium]